MKLKDLGLLDKKLLILKSKFDVERIIHKYLMDYTEGFNLNYGYMVEPVGSFLLSRNIWKLSWEPIVGDIRESINRYSYVGEITSIDMFAETSSCLYLHLNIFNEIIIISKDPKLITVDYSYIDIYSSGGTQFKFIYPFLEKRRGSIDAGDEKFVREYVPELYINHYSENHILLTVFDIEDEERRFCRKDNTKTLFD